MGQDACMYDRWRVDGWISKEGGEEDRHMIDRYTDREGRGHVVDCHGAMWLTA